MDSIVTPEHLYALFYGFNECTTIKKFPLPFKRSLTLVYLFICSVSRLSYFSSLPIAVARIRQFRLLSYLPYYTSVFICWHFIHIFSYRFPGNCCDSQHQPRRLSITSVSVLHTQYTYIFVFKIVWQLSDRSRQKDIYARKMWCSFWEIRTLCSKQWNDSKKILKSFIPKSVFFCVCCNCLTSDCVAFSNGGMRKDAKWHRISKFHSVFVRLSVGCFLCNSLVWRYFAFCSFCTHLCVYFSYDFGLYHFFWVAFVRAECPQFDSFHSTFEKVKQKKYYSNIIAALFNASRYVLKTFLFFISFYSFWLLLIFKVLLFWWAEASIIMLLPLCQPIFIWRVDPLICMYLSFISTTVHFYSFS